MTQTIRIEMQKPPIPINEASRIDSLIKLDVLDTDPQERFDRITRLTKKIFDVPIALISLVDSKRQWFKSKQGLDATETSREISFCGHAIAKPATENSKSRILEVQDAIQDNRFFDNPLVTGDPKIRFYAGFILQSHQDYNLGTLCIIDNHPRKLSDSERESFYDLGMIAQNALQSLRHEDKDIHTGLYNRRGFLSITEHIVENSKRNMHLISLAYIELTNYESLIEKHGKLIEQEILSEFVNILKTTFRQSDLISRIGENKFVVLSAHNKFIKFDLNLNRFKENMNIANKVHQDFIISFRANVISCPPHYLEVSGRLLDLVDKRMMESSFEEKYSVVV